MVHDVKLAHVAAITLFHLLLIGPYNPGGHIPGSAQHFGMISEDHTRASCQIRKLQMITCIHDNEHLASVLLKVSISASVYNSLAQVTV